MATTASAFSLLILFLLTASAVARPCKTLIISTYTVSQIRPDFFTVVAESHEFHPRPLEFGHPRALLPSGVDRETLIRRSPGSSSLRDRTVDLLRVLASLLLGAACGALTGFTIYFVCSLFNWRIVAYRRSFDGFSSDEDNDADADEEDIFNPKKLHSTDINSPAAPTVADSVETALLKKDSV